MPDLARNFVKATLASGISAGATSLSVVSGGSLFSHFPFNAWIWNATDYDDSADDPEVEIVRVTNQSSNTLTIIRAQEGTSAVAHNTILKTYKIVAGETARTATDIGQQLAFNAKTYGLVGDGVTDDTAALQSLVDLVVTRGGGTIFFPPGTYLIGGALQDTGGRNAQILLPVVPTSQLPITIELCGAIPPPRQFYMDTPLPSPTVYSIIKSTLVASPGTASFIAGKEASANLWDNVQLIVRDMVFQAPPNPTFIVFNSYNLMGGIFEHVLIHTGSLQGLNVTEPTHVEAQAIRLAPSLHSAGQRVDQCDVWGFYIGLVDGELAENDINVWSCKIGIAEPFSYHLSTFRHLGLLGCQRGIAPTGVGWTGLSGDDGTKYLRVFACAIESGTVATGSAQAWQERLYDVDDPLNLLKGDLQWLSVAATVGNDHTFLKNGGTNFLTSQIGSAPTGFVRSRTREYDSRDYLTGDGTTDDAAALQTIYNQIEADEDDGIIYFDNAIYQIGGALQDTGRINAQLILPEVAITGRQYSVRHVGYSVPACSPSGYEPIELPSGTRIRSSLSAGSGSDPSVISGRGPVGGYLDETDYLHAEFENIIFETVANPSYSCINARRLTTVALKNCLVAAGPHMDAPHSTQPTSTDSYGIILPQYNSGICQRLEGQVNVFGFYTGIRGGELMHAENIGIWWCQRGLEFPFSYHASLIDRLLVFWSPIGAIWTAVHPVEIQQWDNEHTVSGESAWYATVSDISDGGDNAFGEVKWLTVRASFGRESVFTVVGGANLVHRELGVVDTGGGDTPSGMFNDFFTDTNGTELISHSPDIGTGWTRFEGGSDEATILSGCVLAPIDISNAYSYYADDTQADVIITVEAKFPVGGTAGQYYCELIFRYTDSSNYWILRWGNLASNNFQIVKHETGSDTIIQQTTKTFAEGEFSELTVMLSGTAITCEVDLTQLTTTSSFNSTAVKHGLRVYRAGALLACMDNFRIVAN